MDGVTVEVQEPVDNGQLHQEKLKQSAEAQKPIKLKKNDCIQYKLNESGDWTEAKIMGRGGKATGSHCNYYNIKDKNGQESGVNLDTVKWKRMEHEETNVVLVPREKHKKKTV